MRVIYEMTRYLFMLIKNKKYIFIENKKKLKFLGQIINKKNNLNLFIQFLIIYLI